MSCNDSENHFPVQCFFLLQAFAINVGLRLRRKCLPSYVEIKKVFHGNVENVFFLRYVLLNCLEKLHNVNLKLFIVTVIEMT